MKEEEQILTSILGCERMDLLLNKVALTKEQQEKYDLLRARRADGEPLQYILGTTNFMGIELKSDHRALIPRPETEILVELAIEKLKSMDNDCVVNVLELGVGSGNISIALAKNIKNCSVTGIEISKKAYELAQENVLAYDLNRQIQLVNGDFRTYLKEVQESSQRYDLIISNPPYIRHADLINLPADVQHEPTLALDGGENGLDFYQTIIACSSFLLKPNGLLMCEIGDGQRSGIEEIFAKYPMYRDVKFKRDYVGVDRIFIGHKL